jgi:hypothetical protein
VREFLGRAAAERLEIAFEEHGVKVAELKAEPASLLCKDPQINRDDKEEETSV